MNLEDHAPGFIAKCLTRSRSLSRDEVFRCFAVIKFCQFKL